MTYDYKGYSEKEARRYGISSDSDEAREESNNLPDGVNKHNFGVFLKKLNQEKERTKGSTRGIISSIAYDAVEEDPQNYGKYIKEVISGFRAGAEDPWTPLFDYIKFERGKQIKGLIQQAKQAQQVKAAKAKNEGKPAEPEEPKIAKKIKNANGEEITTYEKVRKSTERKAAEKFSNKQAALYNAVNDVLTDENANIKGYPERVLKALQSTVKFLSDAECEDMIRLCNMESYNRTNKDTGEKHNGNMKDVANGIYNKLVSIGKNYNGAPIKKIIKDTNLASFVEKTQVKNVDQSQLELRTRAMVLLQKFLKKNFEDRFDYENIKVNFLPHKTSNGGKEDELFETPLKSTISFLYLKDCLNNLTKIFNRNRLDELFADEDGDVIDKKCKQFKATLSAITRTMAKGVKFRTDWLKDAETIFDKCAAEKTKQSIIECLEHIKKLNEIEFQFTKEEFENRFIRSESIDDLKDAVHTDNETINKFNRIYLRLIDFIKFIAGTYDYGKEESGAINKVSFGKTKNKLIKAINAFPGVYAWMRKIEEKGREDNWAETGVRESLSSFEEFYYTLFEEKKIAKSGLDYIDKAVELMNIIEPIKFEDLNYNRLEPPPMAKFGNGELKLFAEPIYNSKLAAKLCDCLENIKTLTLNTKTARLGLKDDVYDDHLNMVTLANTKLPETADDKYKEKWTKNKNKFDAEANDLENYYRDHPNKKEDPEDIEINKQLSDRFGVSHNKGSEEFDKASKEGVDYDNPNLKSIKDMTGKELITQKLGSTKDSDLNQQEKDELNSKKNRAGDEMKREQAKEDYSPAINWLIGSRKSELSSTPKALFKIAEMAVKGNLESKEGKYKTFCKKHNYGFTDKKTGEFHCAPFIYGLGAAGNNQRYIFFISPAATEFMHNITSGEYSNFLQRWPIEIFHAKYGCGAFFASTNSSGLNSSEKNVCQKLSDDSSKELKQEIQNWLKDITDKVMSGNSGAIKKDEFGRVCFKGENTKELAAMASNRANPITKTFVKPKASQKIRTVVKNNPNAGTVQEEIVYFNY